MPLGFQVSGSTSRTERFLDNIIKGNPYSGVEALAEEGVAALRVATPRDSGITAESWDYEIERDGDAFTIWFVNTHQVNGFHIVVGLQYGHATGSGGYVPGYDFINPALQPIFDRIQDKVWKEVQQG